jgi:beta-aspartyl-peptidase (threonine type)
MFAMVATQNGKRAIEVGIQVLRSGGSALDAVEQGVRMVEDDPEDQTVGYGGLPNFLGEVELDASIMDGRTLAAGAVAGVKHYRNPISIARKVMEVTPHVLLIAEGAEMFAQKLGFESSKLLTPASKKKYLDWCSGHSSVYPERYEKLGASLFRWYNEYVSKARCSGTVNVLALDSRGNLAAGVSTSGLFMKMPGRVGDSAIVGAGNYADNRYGAAACVGRGELTMRTCLAKMVVDFMKQGMTPQEACNRGIREVIELRDPIGGGVNVIALDPRGNPGSASSLGPFSYHFQNDRMKSPEARPSFETSA